MSAIRPAPSSTRSSTRSIPRRWPRSRGALTRPGIAHAQLDGLGIPILAITSSDDTLFPAMLIIDTMARLTNATIVEIAGAGHSTYFERPDEYNAELLRFIADR